VDETPGPDEPNGLGDAGLADAAVGEAALGDAPLGDATTLEAYARALADGIDATLATWVVRSVLTLVMAWSGQVEADVALAAEEAGQQARADIGAAVRGLLEADIDAQTTTPLALVRRAVRYPTEVLAAAGVGEVERDAFAEAAFPDDVYDLSPATFADIDPSLADVGLAWGAAKAWTHKRRHRGAGA
jgi:hypothetical protein